MPDRLRRNKDSLTNISSLKFLALPTTLLSMRTRILRLQRAELLLSFRWPFGKPRDQAQRNCERFSTTARHWAFVDWRFRRRDIGFAYIGKRKLSNERGQSLLELMIAMSVMSIGFLAIFAVLSQTLGMNRIVANQYVAANLAAEGIEVVKNISDSNVVRGDPWNTGLSNDKFGVQYDSETLGGVNKDWANRKLPLNFNSDTGIYSYGAGTPTNFVRTVTINNINPNEIQVNSEVKWRDKGGVELQVNLEDRLFNWH